MSIGEICSILKYVFLGLDCLVLLFLIIYSLIGLKNGVWKSLASLAALAIPLVIMLFCLTPITNWVLSLDISGLLKNFNLPLKGNSVSEILTNLIAMKLYDGNSTLVESSRVLTLCEGVAGFVVKQFIYSIWITLTFVIVYPINKFIIKKIFFRKKPLQEGEKKEKPSVLSRFLGMGTSLAKSILLFILFVLPIYGTLSLTSDVIDTVSRSLATEDSVKLNVKKSSSIFTNLTGTDKLVETSNSQQILGFSLAEWGNLKSTIDNSFLENNFFSKTRSKNTNLTIDASYLQVFATIDTKDGKLNIIKEYGKAKPIVPLIYKVVDKISQKDFNFNQLTTEDIDAINSFLLDSSILQIIFPALMEYGAYYMDKTYGENSPLKPDMMQDVDWKTEIPALTNLIISILTEAQALGVDVENPQDILNNKNIATSFKNIVSSLLSSTIIKTYLLPVVIDKAITNLSSQYESLKSITDLLNAPKIMSILENNSDDAVDIAQTLYKYISIYKSGTEKIDWQSDVLATDINNVLSKFFAFDIIKTHEKEWVEALLKLKDLSEYVDYTKLFTGLDSVEWETEVSKLISCLQDFVKVIPNDGKITLDAILSDETKFNKLITDFSNSKLLKVTLQSSFDKLITKATSSIPEDLRPLVESLNLSKFETLDDTQFQNELSNLSSLVFNIKKLLDPVTNEIVIEGHTKEIETVLTELFSLNIVMGSETNLINQLLNKVDESIVFTDEELTGVNFVNEAPLLSKLIVDGYAIFKNGLTDANELLTKYYSDMQSLVTTSSESSFLQQVVKKILTHYGKNLVETNNDLKAIVNFDNINNVSKANYKAEMLNLLTILKQASTLGILSGTFDLSNSKGLGDFVKSSVNCLLIKPNQGVFVKYIFDKAGMNSYLGTLGITLSYEVADWSKEAEALGNVVESLNTITNHTFDFSLVIDNLMNNTEVVGLGELLTAWDKSSILSPILFTVLGKGLSSATTGYSVTIAFSETEKAKVRSNSWSVEATAITSVLSKAKTLIDSVNENITSIDEAQVVLLMESASKGLIATKALDNLLKQMLGDSYTLDLSTQEKMGDDANQNLVKNLISAAKAAYEISNSTFDLTSKSSTDNLLSALSFLGTQKEEEVMPILDKVVDNQSVSFSDVSTSVPLLQEVITIYQASDHQSSFSTSDIPATTLEKIDANTFASALINLLKIYK